MMKNMAATIITPMRMYIMSVIRAFLLAGAFDGNQDSTGTGIPKGPIRQAPGRISERNGKFVLP